MIRYPFRKQYATITLVAWLGNFGQIVSINYPHLHRIMIYINLYVQKSTRRIFYYGTWNS